MKTRGADIRDVPIGPDGMFAEFPPVHPSEQEFVASMTSEQLEDYLLRVMHDVVQEPWAVAILRDGINELKSRRLARSAG